MNPLFIQGIMKSKHWDILEHGYLAVQMYLFKFDEVSTLKSIINIMDKFPFMKVLHDNDCLMLGGNIRVWYELTNNIDALEPLVEKQELSELLYTLKQLAPTVFGHIAVTDCDYMGDFEKYYGKRQESLLKHWLSQSVDIRTTDFGGVVELIACAPRVGQFGNYTFFAQHVSRALMAQITRHRLMTFSVRSFRYTEASDLKYVHDIAEEQHVHDEIEECYQHVVKTYANLRSKGVKRQVARGVLPTNIETELVVSGPVHGWKHLFSERTAPDAQGEIRQLAMCMKELYDMV
jgi:hypothetical protein